MNIDERMKQLKSHAVVNMNTFTEVLIDYRKKLLNACDSGEMNAVRKLVEADILKPIQKPKQLK